MIEQFLNILAREEQLLSTLFFFTAIIVLYSIFVFYFYRFLAKRNIIEIDLSQYNQASNPTLTKILAIIFYILEYIVIIPILTFLWFGVLSILTLLLSKGLETNTVLVLTAALVSAVRITSYINEDLAKDLAKMLPFTLLAIAITTAGFFNITLFVGRISEIPEFLTKIPYFVLFIAIVETILRIFEFLYLKIKGDEIIEEETN